MFQLEQMLAPFLVDGLQQNLLFDGQHLLRPERRGLAIHQLIRGFLKAFDHNLLVHAIFFSPSGHRHIDGQNFARGFMQPVDIPLIGIGLGREILIDQILDHLMAHIARHFVDVLGAHDIETLTKDNLTLVIHHIIEFQQLLTHIEIAAFHLGLRPFKRFVDPRMNNRLAFLKAKRGEHFIQTL